MVIYYIVNCPHPVAGTTYGIAGQMFDLQGSTVKNVLFLIFLVIGSRC